MKLKYPLHVMKMADTWAAVPVGSGKEGSTDISVWMKELLL
jgi:hypothetical protein